MGEARKELAERAHMARWFEDREHDRPDPEPARKRKPCSNCGVLCRDRLCRSCLPSGPTDRRVR